MLEFEIRRNALMPSDTEQSFFEDFVLFIPECEACANVLMGVTISANPVLALN
jgi:hypothetical protein